ncbi:SigE family RNA polymerase sigma factor [Thalassiella azotivora]
MPADGATPPPDRRRPGRDLPGPAAPHPDESVTWTPDEAVRALYATHWVPMVRLAHLLLGGSSAAEEVVQDAFVALHRRWPRLRDPATGAAYLRTSVVNGCRSVGRHRSVEQRHRQPGAPEPAGPEERAVLATEGREVVRALHGLSRRQREVLVLRYWADASEAEIADVLGISAGAVKSHASRGLTALRAALGEDGRTP